MSTTSTKRRRICDSTNCGNPAVEICDQRNEYCGCGYSFCKSCLTLAHLRARLREVPLYMSIVKEENE